MKKLIVLHDLADLGKVKRATPRKRVKVLHPITKDGIPLVREKSRFQMAEELCRQLEREEVISKYYVKVFGKVSYITEEEIPLYERTGITVHEERTVVKKRPANPYKRGRRKQTYLW